MADDLNPQQQLFVEAYLETWNATEAAARAGYGGTRNYQAVQGHQLKSLPAVQDAISRRIAEAAMGADEVLRRLAEQGRNDLSAFTKVKRGKPYVDVPAVLAAGKGHLIKGIKYDKQGNVIIEGFDAQAALVQLGRHHKLFTDKSEAAGADGGPILHDVTHRPDLSGLSEEELDALGRISGKVFAPSDPP